MILHTFSTSPFTHSSLNDAIDRFNQEDKILLIQDAVYACQCTETTLALQNFECIYLLQDDINARGITPQNPLYKTIDYNDFVALTLSCQQVITW